MRPIAYLDMKAKIIQKVQANRQKKKQNKIYLSSFSRTSLGSTDDGVHICKNLLGHICRMSKGIFVAVVVVVVVFSSFSRAFQFLFDVMLSLGRFPSHVLRNVMSWIRGQQEASSLNYRDLKIRGRRRQRKRR